MSGAGPVRDRLPLGAVASYGERIKGALDKFDESDEEIYEIDDEFKPVHKTNLPVRFEIISYVLKDS